MAILLNNVSLPVRHTEEMLRKKVAKLLRIREQELGEIEIVRRSIDARKKPEVNYVYLLRLKLSHEAKFLKLPNVSADTRAPYKLPKRGENALGSRPVIIGSGPAGPLPMMTGREPSAFSPRFGSLYGARVSALTFGSFKNFASCESFSRSR